MYKTSRGMSHQLLGYHPHHLFKINFLFTTPVCTLAQHSVQNEGHAEMPDPPVSVSSSYLYHRESVIQALLYSFLFCHSSGGLMVFSAISVVALFEADDDTNNAVDVGQEPPPTQKNNNTTTTHDCMLCCTLLIQLGLKRSRKNHTAQLIHPVGNGTVWYLAVSSSVVSTGNLGPFHLKGGTGCWQ